MTSAPPSSLFSLRALTYMYDAATKRVLAECVLVQWCNADVRRDFDSCGTTGKVASWGYDLVSFVQLPAISYL